MNEFIKMDIFFFITSVAVVLLTLGAACVLWQFSRILKNIEHVSEQAALGSDIVRADILEMRGSILKWIKRLKSLFNFFGTKVRKSSPNKK